MATAPAAVLKAFDSAHRTHGELATYRAGDVVVENLPVIPGKSTAEVFDQNGLMTQIELQDFAVRADLLAVTAGDTTLRIRPERHHLIEIVRDGQLLQFVVAHPNANEAPFRRSDAYGAVLRIHTQDFEPPAPPPAE